MFLLWLVAVLVVAYIFLGGVAAGDFRQNYIKDTIFKHDDEFWASILIWAIGPMYLLFIIARTGKRLVDK